MKSLSIFIVGLAFCLLSVNSIYAQADQNLDYTISNTSQIKLEGTSTMHSFHLSTKVINGNMQFDNGNTNDAVDSLGAVEGMKVVVPVKDLKSGEDGLDEKMRDALKADDNPNITYVLSKVDSVVYKNQSKTEFTMNTEGTLTVAGKSKNIDMKVDGNINGNNIIFKGEKKLLMTDFGVDPPTMFFGVLKTGNEVTIDFDVTLVKK
jgi:hypothetical protein